MATKEQLLEEAARLNIDGRSQMNKDELEAAIRDAGGSVPDEQITAPAPEPEPEVEADDGRPDLEDVAAARVKNRNERVIATREEE